MAVIKIVTDSGADIPGPLADELDITVVPLTINFGDERLLDGVDLQPSRFYERLVSGDHPSTTQPAPADFERMYKTVADGADAIISFHLSGELSGTVQSAAIAAREIDTPIHVVDTRSASLGAGLLAVEAARMAQQGLPAEEIVANVKGLIEGQTVLFFVDTLQYLQRNGRIGRAQAFVGGLLNIKPLLTLQDGIVSPLERARGRRAALDRLLQRIERLGADEPFRFGLMHANVPEEAAAFRERMAERLQVDELTVTQLGPTVGSHVGPGALGVVCYPVP